MTPYCDHDQIGADALRLCEDVREMPPVQLYARLAQQCHAGPERMAQILMCLAAWVDADSPRELMARAEEVAEINRRIADRMVPDGTGFREVLLRADIETPSGRTLLAGTRHLAAPDRDGQWRVQVDDASTVTVPEECIRGGGLVRQTLLRKRDAREEYEFARCHLGYGHESAAQWLQERYEVTDRQLFRWGLSRRELEETA